MSTPQLKLVVTERRPPCFSHIQMTWRQGKLLHTSISVDRIVAGLGYVKGNVRLVCFAFNAFRGSGTDDDMIRLAKALIKHQRVAK